MFVPDIYSMMGEKRGFMFDEEDNYRQAYISGPVCMCLYIRCR
jgi:hypothetical protein